MKHKDLARWENEGGAASDVAGTTAKRDLLASALKRANEVERRRGSDAKNELVANARKALAMKEAADEQAPDRPSSLTANVGMRSLPHTDQAPSGALDAEGQRVVLERSRKVR